MLANLFTVVPRSFKNPSGTFSCVPDSICQDLYILYFNQAKRGLIEHFSKFTYNTAEGVEATLDPLAELRFYRQYASKGEFTIVEKEFGVWVAELDGGVIHTFDKSDMTEPRTIEVTHLNYRFEKSFFGLPECPGFRAEHLIGYKEGLLHNGDLSFVYTSEQLSRVKTALGLHHMDGFTLGENQFITLFG